MSGARPGLDQYHEVIQVPMQDAEGLEFGKMHHVQPQRMTLKIQLMSDAHQTPKLRTFK